MNRVMRRFVRHGHLLLLFNTAVVAATTASLTLTPRVWMTKAELILPNVTSNSEVNLGKLGNMRDGGGVAFSQQLNPLKGLSSIAVSDYVIKQVWDADPEKTKYPKLLKYKTLFNVSPQNESAVISLNVKGSSPELARKRTADLIKVFRQRLQELRQDEATQRSQFMLVEAQQAHDKLLQVQKDLAQFKEATTLVSNESQTQELILTINTLERARSQALSDAQASLEQAKLLSSRLRMSPAVAFQSARLQENKEYQFIRQKLSEVDAAIVEMQVKFTNDHPKLQALRYQQQILRRQVELMTVATGNVGGVNTAIGENTANLIKELILVESQAGGMQKKAAQLQIQIENLHVSLKTLPAKQARLQQLQSQYDIAEGVYNGVVAQAEQAKLGAFSAYPSVQILDQLTLDSKLSSPQLKLILLGALLAAFGSAAIILLQRRNPLLSPKDIHQTQIPLLASIPQVKDMAHTSDQELSAEIKLQRLASAVSLMPLDNGRLMIASTTSSEGKTTITLSLAYALINLGFRVLVVDGDFRTNQLSKSLGYQQQSVINLQLPVNVAVNLDLLSIKIEVNKIAEFVARGGFEQRLSLIQSAGNYDYVLIDSPPVNLTSEAALMAKVAVNVLFVARPEKSDRNPFHNSIKQLTRHPAMIVGLVINAVLIRL
ncbi:MAG: P-loop NTPase [Nostocaceae cyanobacterium]|nr:P-loop NTPase [Nostocaceae cyanobacterium]